MLKTVQESGSEASKPLKEHKATASTCSHSLTELNPVLSHEKSTRSLKRLNSCSFLDKLRGS